MRVAIITGGMGALGESISTKMHAAGYRVVVTHSLGNTKTGEWARRRRTCDISSSRGSDDEAREDYGCGRRE
jgi:NAD(P)-dependent dehydrogenase (short-subunit alcohol dehydrogenase family)